MPATLKDIYNALKGDNQFSQTKDFGTFAKRMNERGYSKMIYDNLRGAGASLPDIGTFRKKLGVKDWSATPANSKPTGKPATSVPSAASTPSYTDFAGQGAASYQGGAVKDKYRYPGVSEPAEEPVRDESDFVHALRESDRFRREESVRQPIGEAMKSIRNVDRLLMEDAGHAAASVGKKPAYDLGDENATRYLSKRKSDVAETHDRARKVAESVWDKAIAESNSEFANYLKGRREFSMQNVLRDLANGSNSANGISNNLEEGTEAFATHLKHTDMERLSDAAWTALGTDGQKDLINTHYSDILAQYPNADHNEAYDMAKRMARAESDGRMYETAVAKNAPKSVAEFFMRKAALGTSVGKMMEGVARVKAGTRGDMEARDEADARYEQDGHKVAGTLGTATSFSMDPLTIASSGTGSLLTRGATMLGGKMIGEAAMRRLGTTIGGKVLTGMIGGAGNLGTLEAGSELAEQMRMGGWRDDEGKLHDGFSGKKVLGQAAHGAGMGMLTGALSPVIGNVADRMVRATGSTAGKIGIRAGEIGLSTVAEGTIFSVPEWIEGKRDKMDVWTDNMAMMVGMRLPHGVKSVPKVIAELRGKGAKTGFVERLNGVLDGNRQDLALTKDEKMELERGGYTDLKSLTEDVSRHHAKRKGAKPTITDAGKTLEFADKPGDAAWDIPYNRFEELMNDQNISEAARAKMYYYLTGHTLPMSTVVGGNMTEIKDADGKVSGYTVESFGHNGVVTRRHFADRKSADVEMERIHRQAELNSIDVGERYYNAKDRSDESLRASAAKRGFSVEQLVAQMRTDKNLYDEVMAERGNIEGDAPSVFLRREIGEEYGVDVDEVIKKAYNKRSAEEQKAVEEYAKRLYEGVKRETEDPLGTAEAEREGADIVEENNLGTEFPQSGAVRATMDELRRAQGDWSDAMKTDEALAEGFKLARQKGMGLAEAYEWMLDNGYGTEESLAPLADVINSTVRAQSMYRGTQEKIEETVQEHVSTWQWEGTDFGAGEVPEPVMLYVVDAKKRRLMVKSGDVRFDEKGRAVAGDMLICLDLDKNEMAYVSAKDVTFVGSEPAKEYAEKYRQKLQEANSAGYEMPEENAEGPVADESPVGEGAKGLPEPGVGTDSRDEAMRRIAKDVFDAEMLRGDIPMPKEQIEGLMEHNRRMMEDERARREAEANSEPVPMPEQDQDPAEEPSGNYEKEAIPVDSEGEPLYERMPRERTVEDLFGKLDDGGLAKEYASQKVAEAEKRLKAVTGKAPKMGAKINEYLRKKAEYETAVQEAQTSVDYWQGVKDDIERLTHTTAEELEEQKRELDGTAAKESMEVEDDTPENGVALAAAILADSKVTPESLKAETGYKAKDLKGFVGMQAKEENGGLSIAKIAENVAEMDRAYYNGRYFGGDDAAARDAVLEALGMARTRGELRALARPNEEKAIREYEDERDRAFYERYGMGYEEYLDYAEQEMVHMLGNLSNFDEEKYLQEHAVEITNQIDKEHGKGIDGDVSAGEEPVHGAGGEVLPGERADESGRGGALAGHGEGETEVRGGHHKDEAVSEETSGGVTPSTETEERRSGAQANVEKSAENGGIDWSTREEAPRNETEWMDMMRFEYDGKPVPEEKDMRSMKRFVDNVLSGDRGIDETTSEYTATTERSAEISATGLYNREKAWFSHKKYGDAITFFDEGEKALYSLTALRDKRGSIARVILTMGTFAKGGETPLSEKIATASADVSAESTEAQKEAAGKPTVGAADMDPKAEGTADPMVGMKNAAERNNGENGGPKRKISEKVRSALESIAEDLGYKMVWHDTLADNGYIDYKKKEIHIAKDAENPLDAVFGHESTHAIRKSSEEEYIALRDAVKRLIGKDKWNDLIKSKREEGGYSEAKLEEEVTGDVVGSIFHDKKMAEGLAQELKGNPGIIAKIREIWHKIIDRLKSIGAREELKQTENALAAFEAVVHAFKVVKEKADAERDVNNGNVSDETLVGLKEKGLTMKGGVVMSEEAARLKAESGYLTPNERIDDSEQRVIDNSRRTMPRTISRLEAENASENIIRILRYVDDRNAAKDAAAGLIRRFTPDADVPSKRKLFSRPSKKMSPIRPQGDIYLYSVDFDTSCPRTFTQATIANEIERRLGRPLNMRQYVQLSEVLRALGVEIPCTYCYVENKRQAKKEAYYTYTNARNAVWKATTPEEEVEGMYGHTPTKNDPGRMTAAATKKLDEWRKQKQRGDSYAPRIEQLFTQYSMSRNVALYQLDSWLGDGKINKYTSENTLAKKLMAEFKVVEDEAKFLGKDAITRIKGELKEIAAEWKNDINNYRRHDDYDANNGRMGQFLPRAVDYYRDMTLYGSSSSQAKRVMKYVPYTDDIRMLSKAEIDYLNSIDGMRFHGNNDYRQDYYDDYLQIFADMTPRSMKAQTYTKNPEFVECFAPTGIKVNMSVAAYGGVDGKPVMENQHEGMAWKTAQALAEKHPDAGAMMMVTNDEQLSYALNSDWITMAIPFHASTLPKEYWYDMRKWDDYSQTQGEWLKNAETMRAELEKDGCVVPKDAKTEDLYQTYVEHFNKRQYFAYNVNTKKWQPAAPHFHPGDYLADGPDGKKQLIPGHHNDRETYLRLCDEYGVNPRFSGRMVKDRDGHTIEVTQHPNYAMLIKEVARTDTEQRFVDVTRLDKEDSNAPVITEENAKVLFGDNLPPADRIGSHMTTLEWGLMKKYEFAKRGGYLNETDYRTLINTSVLGGDDIAGKFIDNYVRQERPLGYLTEELRDYAEVTNKAIIEEYGRMPYEPERDESIDRSKRKKARAYDYDRYPLGRVEPGLADKDVEIVKAGKAHGFANYKEAYDWGVKNLCKTYTPEQTGGKGFVEINSKIIDKYISKDARKASSNEDLHYAVLKVIPQIIKNGIDVETHPNFAKKDGKRIPKNGYDKNALVHRVYAAVSVDGQLCRVKITMKENLQDNTLANKPYSYEVEDISTKIESLEPIGDKVNENQVGISKNSISAAKLLKDVEMSYNPGVKVLDESVIASEGDDMDFSKRNPDIHYSTVSAESSSVKQASNDVAEYVAKVSEKTGGKVEQVGSVDEIANEKVKADIKAGKKVKGWYDGKTGKVYLYLPNVHDRYTAEKVVWHETVGHKGMRGLLGEKGYRDWLRGLWYDLDNPVNAELRQYVKDRMAKGDLSMYDAIEEYVADAAEKGKGKPGFWNGLRNGVTTALHEAGYRISPNVKDVQYMLWLAKNVQQHPDDPVWKMRAAAAKWKIDHREMRLSKERGGELVDNDGHVEDWDDVIDEQMEGKIHFSTSPAAATEIDQYNRAVGCKTAMLKESALDKMNAVMELMKVLIPDMKRVEDVNPLMNPLMAENLMASQISARGRKFVNQEMARLTKAYNEAIDAFPGKNTEERMRATNLYMIEKHGLERNRVFYVRDYIGRMRKKGDEQGADILQRQWNAEKKDLGDKLRNGQINLLDYYNEMDKWIRLYVNKKYKAENHDYSGMHGLQDIDNSDPYDDTGAIAEVMAAEARMEGNRAGSVQDLWKSVKDATDFAIHEEYRTGYVPKEGYERLRDMFDWYVPLRRYDEQTMEDTYSYLTSNVNASNSIGLTIKKAKGRKSLSDVNVLAQIGAMADGSMYRGGGNVMRQSFARMVAEYEKAPKNERVVTEIKGWAVKSVDANGNEVWTEVHPPIPADDTDQVSIMQAYDAWEKQMEGLKAKGDAMETTARDNIPYKFLPESDRSQHIVSVWMNGRRHDYLINGNPRAAQALNGLLRNKTSATALAAVNRFLAQSVTSWNPEFMLRNTIRDFGFASHLLEAKEGASYWVKFEKHFLAMGLAPAGRVITAKNLRDAKNGLFVSLFKRYEAGTLDYSKPYHQWFAEFMETGGMTGIVTNKGLDAWKKMLKGDVKKLREGLMRNPALLWKTVFGCIENANEMCENITRFATFCASRESGRTMARSAYDAHEVSVNFNRSGSGNAVKTYTYEGMGKGAKAFRNATGFFAGWMRNYTMFFNASVQSFSAFAKNTKAHPVRSTATLMALPFGVAALMPWVNAWLQSMLDDDDDRKNKSIPSDAYSELPDFIRRNSLCIYRGVGEFVTIPLSIETRAFYGLGDLAAGYTFNPELKSQKNVVMDIAGQLSQIVPVGDFMSGSSFGTNMTADAVTVANKFVQSMFAPLVELVFNVDWKGTPIMRDGDYLDNSPSWMRAPRGTFGPLVNLNKWVNAETNSIQEGNENMKGNDILDWMTNPAALEHLYDSYVGGAGTFIKRTGRLGNRLFHKARGNDVEIEMRDVPFVRSLLYTPSEQTAMARTKAKWYRYKEDIEKDAANIKVLKRKDVPLDERIRNNAELYKLQHNMTARRVDVYQRAEKQMKAWKKRKARAQDDETSKYCDQYINQIMSDAVKQMDAIK